MGLFHLLVAASGAALAASAATAQSATVQSATDTRRAELLRQRKAIDAELRRLDAGTPTPAADARPIATDAAPASSNDIIVTARALTLTTKVAGQTDTTVTNAAFRNMPATSLADIVKLSPGVTVTGGNGPRDSGVSIRGSNARNAFGARNVQVFEDDFPVTQPDGLARFDLTDPHAYGAVDVVRGPSSARYGNYAVEGAINFRTRSGRDLQGIEAGIDGGGFGYRNAYATIGHAGHGYEYALFGSFVRADGATGHNGYQTGTINALATLALSDRDRITGKVIYNEGEFRLSTRLSFNQYLANPYQQGCARAATAAAGCGTIAVLVNGINGTRIAQTADEGDLARDDRRTIIGARYEHDLSPGTTWRTQATFDSRVPFQPTSATPFRGTLNSYNISSDVTSRGQLLGMDAVSFVGAFYNYLDGQNYSFNKTPAGRNGIGAPTQTVLGGVRNMGLRAREELGLTRDLRLVVGLGYEHSTIDMRQTAYAYPLGADPVLTNIAAIRDFDNVAPEASLVWQADRAVRLHARIGTAYGVPQSGQLFVTSAGVAGNNTDLATQTNLGVDLGAEVTFADTLKAELTGYHEWFRNEQVTQSAGVNLLSFTTNVPRSIHRGVELAVNWKPLPDVLPGGYVQANYSYNDQRYTRYVERLTSGMASAAFDRADNRIPGVIPTFVNGRLGYDAPRGPLAGLGGFVEATYRSRYFIDNADLLGIPAYALVNLDLHYDPPKGDGWWSRLSLYASVQNVADMTYVGSASIISDSLTTSGRQNPASVLMDTTGSLYAGQPRTVYVGVKGRF